MSVKVYYSSVCSSTEMRKQQQKIQDILDGKKIPYKLEDISVDSKIKDEMREKAGNPTALPPQIFNGDTYCGDYKAFDCAVENENLEEFLKGVGDNSIQSPL